MNPKNHSYTASCGSLPAREAVAKHYGGSNLKITSADVTITHGANMGLFILLTSITNPGDNILVPEPSYPFYHKNGPVTANKSKYF
jgi:aspartate/methionine/tyrosine aminotransferase